jgi:hypothetical protein
MQTEETITTAEVELATTGYQAATRARDQAESHVSEIAGRRAILAEQHATAQTEAGKLAVVAIKATGDSKAFAGAARCAMEAEGRVRYLGLAVAHFDNVTLRAARRAVLIASLAETQCLETLAQARVEEHEETVKAELQRTARVLGDFETDGYGSRHEELLDAVESAQDEVRLARQAIAAFDAGEKKL